MNITFSPIGVIHTPFTTREGMPIQPVGGMGIAGTVEIFSEYRDGLQDLQEFSHAILLYYFHQNNGFKLRVRPFMDSAQHGLFATRAPKRPNAIGLSVVQIHEIRENIIHIRNVDILDSTPLLDIKPYIPKFDAPENVRVGWLEKTGRSVRHKRSDDRFK